MPSMNRVMLIGRLVRDPEMRHTGSGLAVTSFTIAVDRRSKSADGQKQADFFRCNAWRQLAEIVNEYARKGRLVAVDGRVQINEYNANDGTRKQSVEVEVDNFQMLDRGDDTPTGRDEDDAHDADERPAPRAASQSRAPERSAERSAEPGPDRDERPAREAPAARPAARPAPAAAAGGAARPARPAAKPAEPTYPADDFDDSDPFADE